MAYSGADRKAAAMVIDLQARSLRHACRGVEGRRDVAMLGGDDDLLYSDWLDRLATDDRSERLIPCAGAFDGVGEDLGTGEILETVHQLRVERQFLTVDAHRRAREHPADRFRQCVDKSDSRGLGAD